MQSRCLLYRVVNKNVADVTLSHEKQGLVKSSFKVETSRGYVVGIPIENGLKVALPDPD